MTRLQVAGAAEGQEIIQKGSWEGSAFNEAWKAICRVWASKWNDRAWLSRRATGIKEADLKMAVLLQKVAHSLNISYTLTPPPKLNARIQNFEIKISKIVERYSRARRFGAANISSSS